MKRLMLLILLVNIMLFLYTFSACAEVMMIPQKGNFFQYIPSDKPVISSSPLVAKPFGLGTIAVNGKTLDLNIGLIPFNSPVDIYLVILGPDNRYYAIESDNRIAPFKGDFISQKWRSNFSDQISETLFKNIEVTELPKGNYVFYLAVTPNDAINNGYLDRYYLWKTTISAFQNGMTVIPSSADLGPIASDKAQPSISFSLLLSNNLSIKRDIALTNNDDFIVDSTQCKANSKECTFTVKPLPGRSGNIYTEVVIALDDDSTYYIPVSATVYKCVKKVDKYFEEFPNDGRQGEILLTTDGACSGTIESEYDWIKLYQPLCSTNCEAVKKIDYRGSNDGSLLIRYKVESNTEKERIGMLKIENETITFKQQGGAVGCTFNVSPSNKEFPLEGGVGEFSVFATANCNWKTRIINSGGFPWIEITSNSTGTGDGIVKYKVMENPYTNVRSSKIEIISTDNASSSTFFLVSQKAANNCTYNISPIEYSLSASGGTSSINVTASDDTCSWSAKSNASWLTLTSGSSFKGSGMVYYSVSPNQGTERSDSIIVAGKTHTVKQGGANNLCQVTINPETANFGSSGGTGSFKISKTPTGCNYGSFTTNGSWISVQSQFPDMLVGTETVTYNVTVNNTGSTRTGSISVAGKSHTIIQGTSPATCAVTVAQSRIDAPASGGEYSINITTADECEWRATVINPSGGFPWVSFKEDASSGKGSSTVVISVNANVSASTRTSSIKINDKEIIISQVGGESCTIELTPNSANNYSASGGEILVDVKTSSDTCQWSAVSNSSWLHIISGATGKGNGIVKISVSPYSYNTNRTGSLTIGGKTFTITQTGCLDISIDKQIYPFEGGVGKIIVRGACNWTAKTDVSWIIIKTDTVKGEVDFTVETNTDGKKRTATIDVGGNLYDINQDGCVSKIDISGTTFPKEGGNGSLNVTYLGASCLWTANSSENWIVIDTIGQIVKVSGSGSGKIKSTYEEFYYGGTEINKQYDVRYGGTIELTAVPDTDSTVQWKNCDSPQQDINSCKISNLTGGKIVEAVFVKVNKNNNYYLDLIKVGQDNGFTSAVRYRVLQNSGTQRVGKISIAEDVYNINQGGQVSNIGYTEIPMLSDTTKYRIPPMTPNDTPPDYGRKAQFFKINVDNSKCTRVPQGILLSITLSGNITYDNGSATVVLSPVDLGTEEAWWKYYFKYFSNGENPNDYNKLNIDLDIYANENYGTQYYESLRFHFLYSISGNWLRMINPIDGTYYIMVVGEDYKEGIYHGGFIKWGC